MVFSYMLFHGLFYAVFGSGYLLAFMYFFNPRTWGYQDYPDRVKKKVQPQTRIFNWNSEYRASSLQSF